MKKLLLTLAVLLGLVSTAYAQEVLNPKEMWGNTSIQSYTATATSKIDFLGSKWVSYGFSNNQKNWNDYRCGSSKTTGYAAYIKSNSAIADGVTKFVVNNYFAKPGTINSATLYISANADFSNATTVEPSDTPTYTATSTTSATDWTFEVPASLQSGNLYYKFEFTFPSNATNGFFAVNNIKATLAGDARVQVNLSFPQESYSVAVNEDFTAPEVECDVEALKDQIVYTSSDVTVATVATDGAVTIVGAGTTTIKASIAASATNFAAEASYTLSVLDPYETTLQFSEYYTATGDLGTHTIGNVTFEFAKGNGGTNPAYNKGDGGARIYVKNTITITAAEGYVLKSAKFLDKTNKEVSFNTDTNQPSATRGTLTGATWTPANRFVNSFVFTNGGGSSGNTKVDHITVSVMPLEELDPEPYNNADFKDYEIQTNEEIAFNFPDYAPEFTFTSSDENVAIYDDGKIKPIAAGEATFTVAWEEGNGWSAGSKQFKVTVVSALEDPVFEIVGETAIVVSDEDDLTVEFNYEGVADPQFTIVSSNPEVATATVDAASKTIAVDIIKRGTAKFTFSVAGDAQYDKASIEFSVKICYHDLATILENAKVGETYTGVFPVTLVYENNSYNYVTDGTAWALFYVDKNDVENHIHGAGAVIPAGWTAKYTVYNGLPEFTEIQHDSEIEDHESVKNMIKEYNEGEITDEMVNHVIILNDVVFEEATPIITTEGTKTTVPNFEGMCNNLYYTFRNQFDVPSVEAGTYNVKAAVNIYNTTIQLYPIEYMAQAATTAPEATIRTYAHGEAIEFEGLEEGAHILYRHGGEDPDHNNIFTEAAQAAPRKAAPNTEWTYNHTTHPLTFEQGQAMNVKYMAKKAGKAPSAVKSLVVAADGTTGIENVGVEAAEAVYYNLQGVRVANPESGIYVRVQGGKAEKVSLK